MPHSEILTCYQCNEPITEFDSTSSIEEGFVHTFECYFKYLEIEEDE